MALLGQVVSLMERSLKPFLLSLCFILMMSSFEIGLALTLTFPIEIDKVANPASFNNCLMVCILSVLVILPMYREVVVMIIDFER